MFVFEDLPHLHPFSLHSSTPACREVPPNSGTPEPWWIPLVKIIQTWKCYNRLLKSRQALGWWGKECLTKARRGWEMGGRMTKSRWAGWGRGVWQSRAGGLGQDMCSYNIVRQMGRPWNTRKDHRQDFPFRNGWVGKTGRLRWATICNFANTYECMHVCRFKCVLSRGFLEVVVNACGWVDDSENPKQSQDPEQTWQYILLFQFW